MFLLLAFSRKNPHPCLIPASPLPLAPPTHTHMHFGTLCPSLPGTTENEKSSERENLVFPGQESCCFFSPHFCSGLLVGVESSVESLFSLLFPSQVNLPPAVLEGSPAFPPLPMHSGALTAQDQGLGAISLWLPLSSRCLAGGQSSGSPHSPPGAKGQ